jgi:hypothetical protein
MMMEKRGEWEEIGRWNGKKVVHPKKSAVNSERWLVFSHSVSAGRSPSFGGKNLSWLLSTVRRSSEERSHTRGESAARRLLSIASDLSIDSFAIEVGRLSLESDAGGKMERQRAVRIYHSGEMSRNIKNSGPETKRLRMISNGSRVYGGIANAIE